MAKNKISDLRDHLFATLEALSDPEKPMDLARAHAISEVAQTIINSAKVEVDLLKVVGDALPGSKFFDAPESKFARIEGPQPATRIDEAIAFAQSRAR